jgi:hypothetical protein
VTANLAIATSQTRDGAIRSSAPLSDLKMARAAGAIIPISEERVAAQPPMLIGREVTESEVRNWIRQGAG